MGIKRLEMWKAYSERTGKESIADYLIVGDLIADSLIVHIRSHMPLETDKPQYLQLEEVQGYSYDLAKILKPVFLTFTECNGQWRFHGACYKWETINRL